MIKRIFQLLILVTINTLFAQNDTSTPYSIFGLGIENKTPSAGLAGLGNTGIAQKKEYEINMYNPANLGNIAQGSFLSEFGINGSYATIKNYNTSYTATNANVSHIAIAFPLTKGFGMSLGLLPYTKVGYDIDIENSVEASTDTYLTSISGSGGLSKFYIAGGMKINEKLSLGVDVSFLFGSVNEESLIYSNSLVSISDINRYNGVKLKTGLQYTLPKIKGSETTIGAVVELPVSLSGTQTRNSYRTYLYETPILIEDAIENTLDNFELPLSFGFGVSSILNKNVTTNLDYKKLLWENTNQLQNTESYVDQSIYAFGLEYLPSGKHKFWDNVKYRFGLNYNTGYLNISNTQIDSYFASVGLGIRYSKDASLNIAYSYGKEGTISSGLIQENFHKITLNLSFIGSWFKQRTIF